jgi:hypothetical protein
MACPCFYPVERARADARSRHAGRPIPPLGDIWCGVCRLAPEDEPQPAPINSQQFCNFGYAAGQCPRFRAGLPDAVRFCVSHDQSGIIRIQWVIEKDHLPFAQGSLEYSRERADFTAAHADARLTRQAQVYVSSYLRRTGDGPR